jgi:Ca2+-binding RTX toxin-like protein
MASTITVTGDYRYDDYKIEDLTNTEIDASNAKWIVANMGSQTNNYPVSVRDSTDVILTGGTINGEVSLVLDWEDAYVNSAAVSARDVDNILIRDWTISRAWDAIRFSGSASDTFTVDNVWLTNIRDDGIENDNGMSGTIRDSLFDGVFVGISTSDSDTGDQTDNVVTLDNVLMRMESFEYKGKMTHQSPFKVEEGKSPGLRIHDSIIAIENVNHEGQGRLEIAWDKVISASNNYFLNLSDTPLPSSYPKPPAGFTILQGAAARQFWETARNQWVAERGGAVEVGQDINGTTADDVLTGTSAGETLYGREGSDLVYGLAGADQLNGQTGHDTLKGGTGHDVLFGGYGNDRLGGWTGADRLNGQSGQDTLTGGAGNDVLSGGYGNDRLSGGTGADRFVFNAGSADTVTDFEVGLDTLVFTRAMTDGITNAAQLISTFATDLGSNILFDFGSGSTVLLTGTGSLSGLSDDLVVI